MRKDLIESLTNAVAGLGISMLLVWLLREIGLWNNSPAIVVAGFFFAASVARGFVLRRLFRMWRDTK